MGQCQTSGILKVEVVGSKLYSEELVASSVQISYCKLLMTAFDALNRQAVEKQ